MNREEVLKKLSDIIREVFDDEDIPDVTDETVASDVDGWDSLMHITLVGTIEDEFEITFPMKEVVGFKNVGQMVDAILRLAE